MATIEGSSNNKGESAPLQPVQLPLNQLILVKLNEDNYLIWKQQVLVVVRGHGLDGYLTGGRPCPDEFLSVCSLLLSFEARLKCIDSVNFGIDGSAPNVNFALHNSGGRGARNQSNIHKIQEIEEEKIKLKVEESLLEMHQDVKFVSGTTTQQISVFTEPILTMFHPFTLNSPIINNKAIRALHHQLTLSVMKDLSHIQRTFGTRILELAIT
ncbi:hypothetical protein ACS0TY_018218 [Phlomoides rotata]